jgi:hypothetical protein
MAELKRRMMDNSVWITLRANKADTNGLSYGQAGFIEEVYGLGTLAIPLSKAETAKELKWAEIGLSHSQSGYLQNGKYIPSDTFADSSGNEIGLHLVIEQAGNAHEPYEWHLHQDLVVSLNLRREGDNWLCISEGYEIAARLTKGEAGKPQFIQVKAPYLKDYLCAREMVLVASSYFNRQEIFRERPKLTWKENPLTETIGSDFWEGRIIEINEEGARYGSKTLIHRAGRTNVDPNEDVPLFQVPASESVSSETRTVEHLGQKLFDVVVEYWKNELVQPGEHSPRIRGDVLPPTVSFITDAKGTQETRETLIGPSRWLWFRPDVMQDLAHRRGGDLSWYTRNTGSVGCSPGYGVHFGVNSIGLINVYAKDIAQLPEWQQKIWAGHNLGPDGGVSEELLASQMEAKPAATKAPEAFLYKALSLLSEVSVEKLGRSIWREHEEIPNIIRRSHRFRAIDKQGLLALAKDLARLTADSFDEDSLRKIVPEAKKEWGSLKLVQTLLSKKLGEELAKEVMGPIAGIYELRHGDAHLPSKQIEDSFKLAGVDTSKPYVLQGFDLLDSCVATISSIVDILSTM